jgi:hypothetical protein
MKNKLLILFFLTALAGWLCASPFSLVENTRQYVEITFETPAYSLDDVTLNGNTYQRIVTDAEAATARDGYPELPMFSTLISLPGQGGCDVEMIDCEETTVANVQIAPAIGSGAMPLAMSIDRSFYSTGSLYPTETFRTGTPSVMRELRVAPLTVQPFAYDPAAHRLVVRTRLTLRVHFNTAAAENEFVPPAKHSRAFAPFYNSLVVNNPQNRDEADDFQPPCILIIHPNQTTLTPYVQQLADWKRTKGFEVHMVGTNTAGTSNSAIKNYITNAYTTWTNPPEYVILVGDTDGAFAIPTWTDPNSGGAGDHPYACLNGNDLLPEVFIGRMSVGSITDMQVELAKMNLVERQPYTGNMNMYQHSVLAGDVTTSSGWSCELTMKSIKQDIVDWDPDYNFTEAYDGGIASAMTSGCNQGATFLAYRGYLGVSGWSESGLNNNNMLFNAVLITCGTGVFTSSSMIEDLLRQGTPTAPKGAVTAIGMSTSSTHTQYNNIMTAGVFYGLYREGMHTMGEAIMRGKLALWMSYQSIDSNVVQEFTYWCNLMGDPSLDVWHTTPISTNCEYESQIPLGQDWLDVLVTDGSGQFVPGAMVTARRGSDEIFASGLTDESGHITLQLNASTAGAVDLTITKPDYMPHLGTFTISTAGQVEATEVVVDDDNNGASSGNGDSIANPGETVELSPTLMNYSPTGITGVTATLTSADPYVTVTDGDAAYPDIAANNQSAPTDKFCIEISPDIPDRHQVRLDLQVTATGAGPWQTRSYLVVTGADLDILVLTVDDGDNNALDGGETASLQIRIRNNGQWTANQIQAELNSLNSLVEVTDSTAWFGNVVPSQEVTCTTDGFTIYGMAQLVPGMQIPMQLVLTGPDGYSETEIFNLPIGTPDVHSPLGPDTYGYMCYDDGDLGYVDTPTYNWVGCAPAEGGSGQSIAIGDGGLESGGFATVELPFNFRFYGEDYAQTYVCSNGFILFEPSEQPDFRNWPIPGPKTPCPMIAAMWDDLSPGSGGVYKYYSAAEHKFVIEWYQNTNDAGGGTETFEIILYDPAFYTTSTFDAPFAIQYMTFNDSDTSNSLSGNQGNRSTIGIVDHTGIVGLQYVYNGQYSTTCKPIAAETALYFTGAPRLFDTPYLMMGDMVVFDQNHNQVVEAGETANLGLFLNNLGAVSAGGVFATLSANDPYVQVLADTSSYQPIEGGMHSVNASFFRIAIDNDIPANHVIALNLHVVYNGGMTDLVVDVPLAGYNMRVGDYMIGDHDGNGDGIMDPGESVQLVIPISNIGTVAIGDAQVSLSTSSPYVTIAQNSISMPIIEPGENLEAVFDIDCSAGAPTGEVALLNMQLTYPGSDPVESPINLGIGFTGINTDFETDDADFSGSGGWEWGVSSVGAHSGTHTWDTFPAGEYPANCNCQLISTDFTLGNASTLTFWHTYATEGYFDGGNVKISTDNGSSWLLLHPDGGYPVANMASSNAANPNEPGYSGDLGWTQATFALADYAGEHVLLKWSFGADGSVQQTGWCIDDVSISGVIANTGVVTGHVTLDNPFSAVTNARVSVGDFTCAPDTNGDYSLYLTPGEYDMNASLTFYSSGNPSHFSISEGQALSGYDFSLEYLSPAEGLTVAIADSSAVLSWNYDTGRAARNANRFETSRRTFRCFNVYRQVYCGYFTLIDSTSAQTCSIPLEWNLAARFYVTAMYNEGESDTTNHVQAIWNDVNNHNSQGAPLLTRLSGNYPNPFNPVTRIAFSLANDCSVELAIYNLRGQKVATLLKDRLQRGDHQATWRGVDDHGRPVASGVYLYRLVTPERTMTRKALLLK